MILLAKLDRLVHRLMRGRCWNRRACLWLSHYAATKKVGKREKQCP